MPKHYPDKEGSSAEYGQFYMLPGNKELYEAMAKHKEHHETRECKHSTLAKDVKHYGRR